MFVWLYYFLVFCELVCLFVYFVYFINNNCILFQVWKQRSLLVGIPTLFLKFKMEVFEIFLTWLRVHNWVWVFGRILATFNFLLITYNSTYPKAPSVSRNETYLADLHRNYRDYWFFPHWLCTRFLKKFITTYSYQFRAWCLIGLSC